VDKVITEVQYDKSIQVRFN